jgi:hypothetical protein
MAVWVVRGQRQRCGQFRFGCREGSKGIGRERHFSFNRVSCRRSNERIDIAGVGRYRAIEKFARLRQVVRDGTPIKPSHTLKIEIYRVWVRSLFRPSSLGGDQRGAQLAGKPGDDFVLHVKEIGDRLIEPLSPDMTARLGVDD